MINSYENFLSEACFTKHYLLQWQLNEKAMSNIFHYWYYINDRYLWKLEIMNIENIFIIFING